jgi:hypothetical protein
VGGLITPSLWSRKQHGSLQPDKPPRPEWRPKPSPPA